MLCMRIKRRGRMKTKVIDKMEMEIELDEKFAISRLELAEFKEELKKIIEKYRI